MMERIKTFVLVLLVLGSLYQSYLLAYSKPDFDPVSQDEYIETEWIGNQEELPDLIFPHEMIVHLGENRHTVLYPNFNFYNMIYAKIRQRSFSGFRKVDYNLLQMDRMKNRNQGIEIRFKEPVPLEILQNLIPLRADSPEMPDAVQTHLDHAGRRRGRKSGRSFSRHMNMRCMKRPTPT